jgi:hypothetical protein
MLDVSFGFRQQNSTFSPLPGITDFSTNSFYLRKQRKILLDIEKAYNRVRLNGLLYKFISLYLPGYLLTFLKSYSEGRTFTVHLNDSTSSSKPAASCLPHGALL